MHRWQSGEVHRPRQRMTLMMGLVLVVVVLVVVVLVVMMTKLATSQTD